MKHCLARRIAPLYKLVRFELHNTSPQWTPVCAPQTKPINECLLLLHYNVKQNTKTTHLHDLNMHLLCYSRIALGVALPSLAIYFTPKDRDDDMKQSAPQSASSQKTPMTG